MDLCIYSRTCILDECCLRVALSLCAFAKSISSATHLQPRGRARKSQPQAQISVRLWIYVRLWEFPCVYGYMCANLGAPDAPRFAEHRPAKTIQASLPGICKQYRRFASICSLVFQVWEAKTHRAVVSATSTSARYLDLFASSSSLTSPASAAITDSSMPPSATPSTPCC